MFGLRNYPNLVFIICVFSPVSYKQNFVVEATTRASQKDLQFCIDNHAAMSSTLQTFWLEAQTDCELETKRLIELYRQLMTHSHAAEDRCSLLLKHQIRKQVIENMVAKVEESLITHSWPSNREVQQYVKEIFAIDKRVTQLILERSINEVYLFLEPIDLIKYILDYNEKELQIIGFKLLLNKYLLDNSDAGLVVPMLTFHIQQLYGKNSQSLTNASLQTIEQLYKRFPQELRILYESSEQVIGLLNFGRWEYLYAPRDNCPDNDRRLALTWSQDKNYTDSDGHLTLAFDANGLVAFGSRYGASLKYLYADVEQQAVYFWLGSGSKSTQWWHVVWPHDAQANDSVHYLMFRNAFTKELLCATTTYDENRRYVTLLSGKHGMDDPACHWLIVRF